MNIVYQLQGVQFEWDSNKARSNIEKHDITFEEAAEVFFDPFYQIGDATPKIISNGEKREFILGYSLKQRLLLVVYLEKGNINRIISARIATSNERKLYEQS
jgi:uncharacterized DUF497 family protein